MSGETKFTPGPWRIEPPHNHEGGDGFSILREDLHEVEWIAEVGWEADAHLIAASPDMYEALEALDAWWTEEWPLGPDTPRNERGGLADDTVEIWTNIRAALAKARGESQ